MLQRNTNCTPGINLLSKIRWIRLFWSLIWNLWDEYAFLSCAGRKDLEIVFNSIITGCHKVLHYHQCWWIRCGKFTSQEAWNELKVRQDFSPSLRLSPWGDAASRQGLHLTLCVPGPFFRFLYGTVVSLWNCGAVLEEINTPHVEPHPGKAELPGDLLWATRNLFLI